METFLCAGGALLVVALILFFYLLNTARKKVTPSTNIAGKKNLLPVYLSLADKPESIIQGMEKLKANVQKTETAGDKWRWVPLIIFFGGVGLIIIDLVFDVLGYFSGLAPLFWVISI